MPKTVYIYIYIYCKQLCFNDEKLVSWPTLVESDLKASFSIATNSVFPSPRLVARKS